MYEKHPIYFWLGIGALIGTLLLMMWLGVENPFRQSAAEKAVSDKLKKEQEALEHLHFTLIDPNQAPASIRRIVDFGYQITLDTPHNANQYVGDRLSCTNCHFAGGDSTGGKNGGISLAGSAATYPKFDALVNEVIDLPKRINLCFERSMSGKPLPLDSKEMLALVTYLHWISRGIPIYQKVPWLGLLPLTPAQKGNPENGKMIYAAQCASCHGADGQGEVQNAIPPLWGPKSFNDQAGMNKEDTFAAFTFYNMPYENAMLTAEQAWDVAAFIVRQPRPGNEN